MLFEPERYVFFCGLYARGVGYYVHQLVDSLPSPRNTRVPARHLFVRGFGSTGITPAPAGAASDDLYGVYDMATALVGRRRHILLSYVSVLQQLHVRANQKRPSSPISWDPSWLWDGGGASRHLRSQVRGTRAA
ncbi:hypothetical protein CTRI78_v005959 [Colletotrichum trifolii]|uniref:Uncharacterized protein n=1 Tax=Colletotrichum trifolii TaxID=5466 RepID=A0A4R8RDS2_COLTR|nr:hypothetical protein CTRI78_v005959 [Colletotrichum trifolii]